jgi:hypothetical protein
MNAPCQGSGSTDQDKILATDGSSVLLPATLALGIAQYDERSLELRLLGHRTENRREADCGWFRLVAGAPTAIPDVPRLKPVRVPCPLSKSGLALGPDSVFRDLVRERHRNDG